jgi:Fe2+ or Zn2+ uptake regulation protein
VCLEPVTPILLEVVRYLCANPEGCDTAEGIARWWLQSAPNRESLMRALHWLIEQGFMDEVVAADGHTRYRRRNGAGAAGSDWLHALLDAPGREAN